MMLFTPDDNTLLTPNDTFCPIRKILITPIVTLLTPFLHTKNPIDTLLTPIDTFSYLRNALITPNDTLLLTPNRTNKT